MRDLQVLLRRIGINHPSIRKMYDKGDVTNFSEFLLSQIRSPFTNINYEISQGDTVRWTNNDSFHRVVSDDGVSFESEVVLKFNEIVPMPDFFMLIAVIWLLAYFVNLFLLYKFKSIGKQMYLIVFVLGIILSLIVGASAVDPWLYVIDGLGWSVFAEHLFQTGHQLQIVDLE